MSTNLRMKSTIDAGARPALNKNKTKLMLAQGRSRTALSKDDGTPTKAGLFWENLTGQSLHESGLMSNTQFRENNTDYITLNGKKRARLQLQYLGPKVAVPSQRLLLVRLPREREGVDWFVLHHNSYQK